MSMQDAIYMAVFIGSAALAVVNLTIMAIAWRRYNRAVLAEQRLDSDFYAVACRDIEKPRESAVIINMRGTGKA